MTYTKEYMTLKDEFIKRTLMECEAIANVLIIIFSQAKNYTAFYS